MYYPNFYYKLNYIKYFSYNKKNRIRKNYKYNIKKLKKYISKTLT